MDVDRESFPVMLPTILKHIAESHFIAFDLELSGIPTQRQRHGDGKQTLAQRYEELKLAAETFHILQVGITCVEEDADNEKYLMRSYNFNISPLIYEKLEIERNFTYSTGAVAFLLQHNYHMDAPFAMGIPYLTRSETELARERAILRWDKDAIPDIRIRADDTEALRFMEQVRNEIDDWKKTLKPNADYYSVWGKVSPTEADPTRKIFLNRFEKRLVHQLVRSEYGDLQTSSRSEAVQVQRKNHEEQNNLKEDLQRRLTSAIFTQVGFRWIAEAMAGGDLSGIDPTLCSPEIVGEPPIVSAKAFEKRLDEIKSSLKRQRKVLVGHNCILDLVYIYRYFYGDLPDTVDEFQEILHEMFPIIVDTKYMATTGAEGQIFRSSQLWQIEEALSREMKPQIGSASDHPKYVDTEKYHEAGFDSYVTANVFLKLAAKLEESGRYDDTARAQSSKVGQSEATPNSTTSEKAVQDEDPADASSTIPEQASAQKKKSRRKARSTAAKELSDNALFHTNMYDQLLHLPQDAPPPDLAETPTSSSAGTKPEGKATAAAAITSTLPVRSRAPAQNGESSKLIPSWEGDFWRVYGNKLRVYGTVEEVCNLSGEENGKESEGQLRDVDDDSGGAREAAQGSGAQVGGKEKDDQNQQEPGPQRRPSIWEMVVRVLS